MAGSKTPSAYIYEKSTLKDGMLKGRVSKKTESAPVQFSMDVIFYRNGAVRVTIDEDARAALGTDENGLNWRRYDKADQWAFSPTPKEIDLKATPPKFRWRGDPNKVWAQFGAKNYAPLHYYLSFCRRVRSTWP